ncbi:uncharacterized protein C8Q71DRAFT_767736 [Rhodofomes roseus]|uniref:Leucine rich repeat (LRR) protein n=1 Tax=Rhodofomes roseus TaxID=34475 RepID=A0ABQ8KBM2_9APHY|nr:uncharacterized protein C8Q71DRAFT_767736 [Rhodofomes roseus]KAH9834953.1 hypothetical protein C8Q71DRAFT_767736 [Rhodofomes roseus]
MMSESPPLPDGSNDCVSPSTVSSLKSGPSACHTCLSVYELFDMIVREVYGEGEGKGTVASLAATSKAFHGGAIPILWEKLETLNPLLEVIPMDVWMQALQNTDPASVPQQIAYPHDSPIRRAMWYGQHIKRISWSEDPESVNQEIYAVGSLTCLPPTLKLLRNLRSFSWTERRPSVARFLHPDLFVNPSLQELSLDTVLTEEAPLCSVLDAVRETCPQLRRLRLAGDSSEPLHVAVGAALADLVRATELIDLSCTSPLFDDVLLAIVESTSLQHVDVKVNWYTLDNMVVSALPSACLVSVRTLTLRFEALSLSSLALLEIIGSSVLFSLAIHVNAEVFDNDLLTKHLAALTQAPFAATLRKIEIHAWRMDSEEDGDCPSITFKTLEPLLELKKLTHFVVYAKSFAMSACDVRAIALAFPDIQTLEFMAAAFAGGEPPVGALQHLVELCPDLTLLTMPVTAAFGVPYVEPGWKPRSRVTTYAIATPAEDAGDPRVFAYLSALFPYVPPDTITDAEEVSEDEKYAYAEYLEQTRPPGEPVATACSRSESWAQIIAH